MRRGEVWLVRLEPTVGAEIGKTRPAIIVNDDAVGILPLCVVVPITEWKEPYAARDWIVRLEPSAENGLKKPSAADTFQVRSVSQSRLIRQLGIVSETTMQEITQALSVVLDID